MASPLEQAVRAALSTVYDPEIGRPIDTLGMVRSVEITDTSDGAAVTVGLDLTVERCPMRTKLVEDITQAVSQVPEVAHTRVDVGVMTPEQRTALRTQLRGSDTPTIPFAQVDSLTQVFAIASGKGGVGKSTVTANLAVALAAQGLSVGVIDADIYGFSIPRMLGVDRPPTSVDGMLLPPIAHGVKVISIGMFIPKSQAVVWRGPMLHRALEQFLADVYWGDLDVLLLDLPPGTGDIAISVAQLLPNSQLVIVTTPQVAAAEVAERAGAIAAQTKQKVVGVIENMSWLVQPDGSTLEVFGSGGGQTVATNLTQTLKLDIPLLGQIPLDIPLREAGDGGQPVVLAQPESPSAQELSSIASQLTTRRQSLLGRRLSVNVN